MLKLLAGTLLLAALSLGCDDSESPARLGLETMDGTPGLRIHFRSCKSDARATHFWLRDAAGTRRDGSDDRVLWELVGDGPATGEVVVDSIAPEGNYRLVVPFDAKSDLSNSMLRLTVETSSVPEGESLTVRYGDLRPGEILTKDGPLTEQEFEEPVKCG